MDTGIAVSFASWVVLAASQCLKMQPDKQSYSGTEIVACRNMVCCAEYCLWEPSCYSVDWNSLDNKCFAHYKAKSAQKAQCPCTRFKKIKSCKPVSKKCMIEIASSRLISTRELEGPANAEECSELCRMSRKCYGVSYNGTNCLWADTATGVTADAGTTTYTQNSACLGDYYIKSTRYPGSPVEDLPPVNVPTSIYCATLCYGTVGCTGFTFEQKTHVCYRGQTFPSVDDYIPI